MTIELTGDENIYLKCLGSAERRVRNFWIRDDPGALSTVGFPARPRVEEGDILVYYFAGWQTIVGIAEVKSDVRFDRRRGGGRWPWYVEVYPWLLIPFAEDGISLGDVGISTLSVRSHSHIRIDHATYRRILAAFANEQALNGERYYASFPDWTAAAA